MLGIMFLLMFFSSWNDAATFDESAHIGAGYSYITQKDMRLNPEHPPLMKDIAGIFMLPLRPTYRTDTPEWQNGVNEQWTQGARFLYEWGNNPDSILHLARFPIMLLAIIIGAILFTWIRGMYGNRIALLATFFYAFSPTAIAHSRFVTTDTAATFGFLVGIIIFLKFLSRPTPKRILIAGLVFGVAQSLKFSLFLLIPMYLFLAFVWLYTDEDIHDQSRARKERVRLFFGRGFLLYSKTMLIFVIGALVVWLVYTWHVWNYPQEKQLSDAQALISGFKVRPFVSLDLWLINHKLTRPLGHYLTGVMMVSQRTAGGNSAYFLGEVSSKGWLYYFPAAYLLKETLAFHILTLLALALAIRRIRRAKEKSIEAIRSWVSDNFPIFASLFVIAFYWAYSMANPLNIGVRHVLPTFPFIYLLVSRELMLWVHDAFTGEITSLRDKLYLLYHRVIAPVPRLFFLFLMLLWLAGSTIMSFPYYLSYFNELAGGTSNGHKYITDSNYDWGQDLKRLRDLMNTAPFSNEKVYLNYFGGGSPHYYLGNRVIDWWSAKGAPPPGSLFAISANTIQGDHFARRDESAHIKPEDTYPWLTGLKPFGRAGTSIFLYRMP